jgi:hypothetical protein
MDFLQPKTMKTTKQTASLMANFTTSATLSNASATIVVLLDEEVMLDRAGTFTRAKPLTSGRRYRVQFIVQSREDDTTYEVSVSSPLVRNIRPQQPLSKGEKDFGGFEFTAP